MDPPPALVEVTHAVMRYYASRYPEVVVVLLLVATAVAVVRSAESGRRMLVDPSRPPGDRDAVVRGYVAVAPYLTIAALLGAAALILM